MIGRETSQYGNGTILVVAAIVLAIRITAPSDMHTGDQPLQAAYVTDIVRNGSWLVQHLPDGVPAAKPPLYNWLAAAPMVLTGRSNPFLLKLPSIAAGLLLLLLIRGIGQRLAGRQAATWAALFLAVTPMFAKHIYFARTDMLLAALIAAQIWAALSRKPLLLWTAAALAMLTKGPIGYLPLVALALWWWWRGELREQWMAMRVTIGLPLSLLPFLVWFGAALAMEGRAVWDQMVVAETIDRFAAGSKSKEHRHVLYYVPHFLGRMAPASLLAVVAMVSLRWRRNDRDDLLLAAFWVLALLAVLSLVPSKRADRLFPILPGACILAGAAIEQGMRGVRTTMRLMAVLVVAAGIFFAMRGMPAGGSVIAILGAAMLGASLAGHQRMAAAALVVTMLAGNLFYQHGELGRTKIANTAAPINPTANAA